MQTEILNLDALRAPSRKVRFLGKEYELGYIPSGAAIPVMEAFNALRAKQAAAAGSESKEDLDRYARERNREITDDTITFVAGFCSFFYPEVTRETIAMEANKDMVDIFFSEIVRSIIENSARSRSGEVDGDASKKNMTGPKR